eukprot:TRINITY_DN1291_c3_g1_i1.p1 TRINITY_DN1291_c3_g1~~TRINITY_DN1291_c3_g1_i1.p1  ORF type:complete len:120 (+),score=40.80 TRINITY_DN1291_c3_g1_i1:54-413(+)
MSSGIVYSCIADNSGVIIAVSHNPVIDQVVDVLLENIDFQINHKKSFSGHPKTRGHTVQYVVYEELCFLSAAAGSFQQRICFAYLERLKREFFDSFQGNNNRIDKLQSFMEKEMDFFFK